MMGHRSCFLGDVALLLSIAAVDVPTCLSLQTATPDLLSADTKLQHERPFLWQ